MHPQMHWISYDSEWQTDACFDGQTTSRWKIYHMRARRQMTQSLGQIAQFNRRYGLKDDYNAEKSTSLPPHIHHIQVSFFFHLSVMFCLLVIQFMQHVITRLSILDKIRLFLNMGFKCLFIDTKTGFCMHTQCLVQGVSSTNLFNKVCISKRILNILSKVSSLTNKVCTTFIFGSRLENVLVVKMHGIVSRICDYPIGVKALNSLGGKVPT